VEDQIVTWKKTPLAPMIDNEAEWKTSGHEPLSAHLDEWIQPFVLARLEEHAQEQKVSVGVAVNAILRQYLYSEGM
jgi:hypothetical protein